MLGGVGLILGLCGLFIVLLLFVLRLVLVLGVRGFLFCDDAFRFELVHVDLDFLGIYLYSSFVELAVALCTWGISCGFSFVLGLRLVLLVLLGWWVFACCLGLWFYDGCCW